jgi:hypothetical protein
MTDINIRKRETTMATNTETQTRQGTCPSHGHVTGEREIPRLRFPFIYWFAARKLAARKAFRCPQCRAEVAPGK